jgi:DNA-binding response OmpR family regulator
MPRLDGFEVLKRLRANPIPNKWQPVIIVSALGELEDMKKGYSLEADYYIGKPCEIEVILKGIATMLHLIPVRKTQEEIKHSPE